MDNNNNNNKRGPIQKAIFRNIDCTGTEKDLKRLEFLIERTCLIRCDFWPVGTFEHGNNEAPYECYRCGKPEPKTN